MLGRRAGSDAVGDVVAGAAGVAVVHGVGDAVVHGVGDAMAYGVGDKVAHRDAVAHPVDSAVARSVGGAAPRQRVRRSRAARRLTVLGFALFANYASADDEAADPPVWSADPTEPGPALPPAGSSLFDRLFTEVVDGRAVPTVPFPFSAVLDRLNERSGGNTRAVLIPLGRSLQRGAAYPDFFDSPRVVAAVVGHAQDSTTRAPLENRLFVGYQERSGIIEVISYNETAGRFEFQIVRNYREGGEPDVRYAERSTCLPCHQNHGPIFSRPLWDETNANAEVGSRLAALQEVFHGVPARVGVDVPDAFDTATDRANRLSAWQRIWVDGCGPDAAGVECRAALLAAALRYVLAGGRHLRGADGERARIARVLTERWPDAWPGGLAIPNPDIPNRRLSLSHYDRGPLDLPGSLQLGEPLSKIEVAALSAVLPQHEPFNARAPLEVWDAAGLGDARLDEIIAGLASFFSPRDAALLDALLSARWDASRSTTLDMACRMTPSTSNGEASTEDRYRVACGGRDGHRLDATLLLDRHARDGAEIGRGALHRLSLPGADRIRAPQLTVARTPEAPNVLGLVAVTGPSGLRMPSGDAVARIDLEWNGAADEDAMLSVEIVQDFVHLQGGIDRMVERAQSGESDALGPSPFRRHALLGELFIALGATYPADCCGEPAAMPPALLQGTGGR